MKRSFPPPAREALCALVGVLVCGPRVSPTRTSQPGAPVLKEFTIVVRGDHPHDGHGGHARLRGRASSAARPAIRWGTWRVTPPDGLCRQASAMNWCTCVPDAADDTGMTVTWDCSPFTNVSAVIAVFDRLLDTTPLDPGDAAGVTDVVTTMAGAGAPEINLVTDYSSTGAANGLIFNLFGPFFGNFRAQRPQPVLGAAARVSLGHDRHRQPAGRQGPRQGRHDAVHGQRPAAGRNAGVHDGAVQRRGGGGQAVHAGDRGCPGDGADPGDGGVHAISSTARLPAARRD